MESVKALNMPKIKININSKIPEAENPEPKAAAAAAASTSTVVDSSSENNSKSNECKADKESINSPPSNKEEEKEYYRYETDVKDPTRKILIYTDPSSKQEFVLNKSGSDWVPRTEENYDFDGSTYTHTDETTGQKMKWNLETKSWDKVSDSEESELDSDKEETPVEKSKRLYRKRKAAPGTWNMDLENKNVVTDPETGISTYKDPKDGMVYEWDRGKNAWFPKIDEDFMAAYQMNYGFTADGTAQPTRPEEETPEENKDIEEKKETKGEEKKKESKPEWFDQDLSKTKKVYVSGFPEDINEERFTALMSKYGMIENDIRNDNKPKIKLYKNSDGIPKGDGICTFVMVESVALAIQMLDDSLYEDGKSIIKVERAQFQLKGDYDPKLKPKKLKKKELERLKKQKDKKLGWELDAIRGTTQRAKNDKIIVISNLFKPQDFDEKAEKNFGNIRETS